MAKLFQFTNNIDYNDIDNKPKINNVTVEGNKSLADYGIQPAGNYAHLNANGKVPLEEIDDSLLGNLQFQGLWDAKTNSPELPLNPTINGQYWIVSESGDRFGTDFNIGDWIVATNGVWRKIDNTDAVISVNGKIGKVVLTSEDIAHNDTTVSKAINNEINRAKESELLITSSLNNEIARAEAKEEEIKNVLVDHIKDNNNPHNVTKEQIGLGEVDNTSDINKPISNAVQLALNLKADKTEVYTKEESDKKFLTEHQDISGKQDAIKDLDLIREGAKLGETALQSFTETDPTVPEYVKLITQENITNWNNKSEFSGNYNDLTNKPYIPEETTESKVSEWGFTKNDGTITSVKMNGKVISSSGEADLGTIITEHQDISGKADKSTTLEGYGIIDAYTKLEVNGLIPTFDGLATEEYVKNYHDITKQDKLIAGKNITIENNVISASGSGGSGEVYTAGDGLTLSKDNEFSVNETIARTDNVNSLLANKQDIIKDLDTIRSGASLGASSLQSFTESDPTVPEYVKSITQEDIVSWNGKSSFSGDYNDLTNKPSIPSVPTKISAFENDAGYMTNEYHDESKQDKLTAGKDITIENNVISNTYDDTEILVNISDLQSDVQNLQTEIVKKANTTDVSNALSMKQDTLIFDSVPTLNSEHPVYSNGIKESIDTKQDISTAVNYNNISNCITEIPQDIKLELNNGTLTLKAGSKLYVPNGVESDGVTKKFDVVTIESDLTYNDAYTFSVSCFLIYDATTKTLYPIYKDDNQLIYDTSTNKITFTGYENNLWSFPLALVVRDTTGIGSISQIFNGFGYIGSTVYALPGIKGLIPNGRNADGSLKNIELILDKVRTMEYKAADNINLNLYKDGRFIGYSSRFVYNQKKEPHTGVYMLWYNPETNVYKYTSDSGATWINVSLFYAGNAVIINNDGKVSSLTPKTVFHALDYNDKSTISGWSMPSDRFIDLTLGASGATYIAPANGWFAFGKRASAVGQYFNVTYVSPAQIIHWSDVSAGASGNILGHFVPVQKSQTIIIDYSVGGDTIICRFIYAEGEK